ncbi:FAD-linked oxidoreductase pytB [Cladobotryum mycophilum]|uniref:FAD-linked oxidoreductase pytB n=1 Tax=Cladobotryum mycophilum TaxID=491253 RepID=A0ABR0S5S8_9HYPO
MPNYPQFAWNETVKEPSAPHAQPWQRIIRISKSFFLQSSRKVTPDQIANVVKRLQSLPAETNAWGEWHAWNIAGSADSAAFAWRDQAYAHLEFIVNGSDDPKTQQGYVNWADQLETYFRPITGPATYTGYMDASISTPSRVLLRIQRPQALPDQAQVRSL